MSAAESGRRGSVGASIEEAGVSDPRVACAHEEQLLEHLGPDSVEQVSDDDDASPLVGIERPM